MESRRSFLKKAALLTGGLGASSIVHPAIQRAMAINPAPGTSFRDAEHVVFLMQENRSFDHCYGTLKGVRGFNDPRILTLPNGNPVWLQSTNEGKTYAPFRLDIKDSKVTWMSSLPHSWANQVDARNDGKYNQWLEAKKSGNKEYQDLPLTLGYFTREDLPFYYDLADAFTVCDHNFCSSLTGTSPNRAFFWTGKIREEQKASSKAHLVNGQIDGSEHISWNTFPERLLDHGVDWRIYQNELSVDVGFEGEEEDWLANFTNNTLEFFKQYRVKSHPPYLSYLSNALSMANDTLNQADASQKKKILDKIEYLKAEIEYVKSNPLESLSEREQALHQRAFTTNRNDPNYHSLEEISYDDKGVKRSMNLPKGDVLHQFRKDVDNGKLPTVSWLVAPCNFSDHPGAPWYGAWYVSEALDILTKNPEVWKKTVFVLTYDENDGYFDHLAPFTPSHPNLKNTGEVSKSLNAEAEFITKEQDKRVAPIGLGYRVPMVVVSPWSRGGYVNSEVFDHTSSIQFLETFLSEKFNKKIREENISSWRRCITGDLTSTFRPYHGETIVYPKPIIREPFAISINKAQYAPVPNNFYALNEEQQEEIKKNLAKSTYLPKQESGIKPANWIPYEIYAEGKLVNNKFLFHLKAGNQHFGDRSAGVGFNMYAGAENRSFTVAPGEEVNHAWQIKNNQYNFKIFSVNGFYREFSGTNDDWPGNIYLDYKTDLQGMPTGEIELIFNPVQENKKAIFSIQETYAGKMHTVEVSDRAIAVPFVLKNSYLWYEIEVIDNNNKEFRRLYAGHVETGKESFTDPLMGGIVNKSF